MPAKGDLIMSGDNAGHRSWPKWGNAVCGIAGFSFCLCVLVYIIHTSSGGFPRVVKSHPLELPLLISPCIILLITAIVYFKFIVKHAGAISALSSAGLLAAIGICLMLVYSHGWGNHLKWMYALFFSYLVWDLLMLDICLPSAAMRRPKIRLHLRKEFRETYMISRYINSPTLVTIVVIWAAGLLLRGHIGDALLDSFVAGVVAFHLVFSSVACLVTIKFVTFKLPQEFVAVTSRSPAKPTDKQASPGPDAPPTDGEASPAPGVSDGAGTKSG